MIKQQDAAADEDEGDDEVDGVNSAGLGEDKERQNRAENGRGK